MYNFPCLVNLALSKFSESEKGAEQRASSTNQNSSLNTNIMFVLTLGPSGCCPLTETGLEKLRGEGRGLTCCKATRWMGRTAECGMDWRSQPPRLLWQSCLSERWRWRSDFPFAARGLDQHREKTGLEWEEECRDKTDSWGPLGTTGSPLGFESQGLSRRIWAGGEWRKQKSQPNTRPTTRVHINKQG